MGAQNKVVTCYVNLPRLCSLCLCSQSFAVLQGRTCLGPVLLLPPGLEPTLLAVLSPRWGGT